VIEMDYQSCESFRLSENRWAIVDPVCRNCGIHMQSVAEIIPMGTSPGLRAFMCERCGSTDSTLVYRPSTAGVNSRMKC
jgi:hypothetical protein